MPAAPKSSNKQRKRKPKTIIPVELEVCINNYSIKIRISAAI